MSIEMISVIVPVYNIAEYLPKSIGSLLSQTYQNIEIITVDDGSTDNSLDVLHQLEKNDERIRVIHQDNGGVTKARLTGVAAAQGEWIGFMDGDDYVEPDMYERLLKNAHQYNADISHCGYQMVFPSRVDYYYNKGHLISQDQETGLKDLLDGSFVEPGLCNKLFRKSLLHSLLYEDVMDFSIKNTEDLLMNFYLFREARASVYEDFCPYHYIVRNGSATQSKETNINRLVDPVKVLEIIKNDCKNQVLVRIINKRIVYRLINCIEQKETYKYARRQLKAMFSEISSTCDKKTYWMAKWAYYSPSIYKFIHMIYGWIKGNNKKYNC